MIFSCPGAEKLRDVQPEIIKCPACAKEVEIWTDEIQVICSNCKSPVRRKQEQSCLDWCIHAKECVGEERFKKYRRNKRG